MIYKALKNFKNQGKRYLTGEQYKGDDFQLLLKLKLIEAIESPKKKKIKKENKETKRKAPKKKKAVFTLKKKTKKKKKKTTKKKVAR